jgi:outer membrane protein
MRTRANIVALAERWLNPPKLWCRTKLNCLRFAGNRLSTKGFALLFALLPMKLLWAQTSPVTPDRPWHGAQEVSLAREVRQYTQTSLAPGAGKTYDFAELVDFAEQHNPQTRVAWQNAKAQAAVLGIARSELYPALTVAALAGVDRSEAFLGAQFFRQTVGDFQAALDLNYTVLDFGARRGRINAAEADALAANFAFNDAHRNVIYAVEQGYYQLLNAIGQEDAAEVSLSNAKAVQQAAEERLKNGLATLPDVLEAQSATAQAEYELQAALGAEEIARGNLATALGISPTTGIGVQPLEELSIPNSLGDTVESAINRAFAQRPDLLQHVAEIRAGNAKVKEARAAYYPSLDVDVGPIAQSQYGLQQTLPWANTAGLVGGARFNLKWIVLDGGARRNRVAEAGARVNEAEAQVDVTRDQIANQVWAAYSNLNTAFRQRQASEKLLEASLQSYEAALESYKYGLRNLLDVTAAERTLAEARSTDVLARTQVLSSLADFAFRTGDSVQPNARRP